MENLFQNIGIFWDEFFWRYIYMIERPYLKNWKSHKSENLFFIHFRTLRNFLYQKPNLATFEGLGGEGFGGVGVLHVVNLDRAQNNNIQIMPRLRICLKINIIYLHYELFAFQIVKLPLHIETYFLNLAASTWNQIVFTIYRLISIQTDVRLVPNQSENGKYNLISVWFYKISKKLLWVSDCYYLSSLSRLCADSRTSMNV